MRFGLVILAAFAAAWASLALLLSGAAPGLLLLPIMLSVALLAWGWRGTGSVPSRGPHVGPLVGRWSAVEGVAIFVASAVLNHVHRGDLIFSAIAIIVGLHLFPLARGIPVRLYYATGAALVFLGVAALLLPRAQQPITVCVGAALILWTTVLVAMLRVRQGMVTPISGH